MKGEAYAAFQKAIGETSFGSYAKKRYRFCGKERDEESGLYYYGARYYAAWTCRFVSIDPLAGGMPSISAYAYAANNPIVMVDLDGLAPGGGPEKQKSSSNNLAQPVEMQDDHGPSTNDYVSKVELGNAHHAWATGPGEISVDLVGEAKGREDEWAAGWSNMSFEKKWANQDRYYAIKNRQNYEAWIDAGNDPEKFQQVLTPREAWNRVNEAAFYSMGGVKGESIKGNEKPMFRFTGSWSPSPVALRPTFGYKPTFVPIKVEVPAKAATFSQPNKAPTVSVSTVSDGKSLPGINTGIEKVEAVHKNSNNAVSHFGIYVIKINGVVYKFGKADLTYIVQTTGLAERLNTQIRQLKNAYPDARVEGKLIEDCG